MNLEDHKRIVRKLQGECQRCGACCRRAAIEVGMADVLREPRLFESPYITFESSEHRGDEILCWLTGYVPNCHCPFLTKDGCSIYATRPGSCVMFEGSGHDCQRVREIEGL